MAKEFYTILTAAGKEKLLRATVSNKLEIKAFSVGDGQGRYYEPNEDQVALVNQRYKANVNAVSLEQNQITVECLVPSSVGGFTIRELGIYDKEDTLLLIAKYPATEKPVAGSGSEKDLHIKVILELDNAENVAITADTNVVVATMGNVKNELKKYYNKQEVDDKFAGFNSIEIVNNLESMDSEKALSAAQGKELKQLIDEVPRVEVVDNMTTNNGQKALSAAQGVVLKNMIDSKQSTSQIAISDTEFINKLTQNTLKQNQDYLFINAAQNIPNTNTTLYQALLNAKTYASWDVRVFDGNGIEEVLKSSMQPFFSKQATYIASVLTNKKVVIRKISTETDLTSIKERLDECFQLAHKGKQKIADALVSKGQVVSNSASFQEMAQKIREIDVGYKRGKKLPLGAAVFKNIVVREARTLIVENYPDPVSNKGDYFYVWPLKTPESKYGIADDDEFLYCISGDSYTNKRTEYSNYSSDKKGAFLFLLKISKKNMNLVSSNIIEHFEQQYSSYDIGIRLWAVLCRGNYIYVIHSSVDSAIYISRYTKELTLIEKKKVFQGNSYRFFIEEESGIFSITHSYPRKCNAYSLDRMDQVDTHTSSVERVENIMYTSGGFLVLANGSYNIKSYYYKNRKKIWEAKLPINSNGFIMEKVGRDHIGFVGGTEYIRSEQHISIWFVDIRDGNIQDANTFFQIDKNLVDMSKVKGAILSRYEKKMYLRLGYDEQGYSGKAKLLKNKKSQSGSDYNIYTGDELEVTERQVTRIEKFNDWSSEHYFCRNGDFISLTRRQPANSRISLSIKIGAKYEYGIYLE